MCGSSSSPDPPSVTNANLNAYLEDINGSAYNKNGATSGVYLPYSGNTLTGGGFYVEGNATSVTLSPGTDSKGNLTQIYSIVQGSTTTTITTNVAANTTTVYNGTKTITLTGVPTNKIPGMPQTGTAQTLLYVDGNIGGSSGGGNYTGLSGPGQGQAAIQNGTQLTIVAADDIYVTGDVLYKAEPVTLTTADTLIPANDHNQVLGLFTQSGNFNLTSPYSNNNLEIDGSMAALGNGCASGSCGLETPSSDGINTLTIVGGRMEVNAHGVNMNTSNTYFDRRFQSRASQGFTAMVPLDNGVHIRDTHSAVGSPGWQSTGNAAHLDDVAENNAFSGHGCAKSIGITMPREFGTKMPVRSVNTSSAISLAIHSRECELGTTQLADS